MGPAVPKKSRLVQIINDLGRGGAETLLVGLLPELNRHFDLLLVTLRGSSEFSDNELAGTRREVLGFDRVRKLPAAVFALRRLLKKFQPNLVVSHLYWSTIVARLATPRRIPHLSNLHLPMSQGAFTPDFTGRTLKALEKMTYSRREILLGVSHHVVKDYDRVIGVKGRRYVLYNYVNDAFFESPPPPSYVPGHQLRLVAVGNPRPQKNYEQLVRAMTLLEPGTASCDVYGDSPWREELQRLVDKLKVPVFLKGKASDIHTRLRDYDAYLMCSGYEGFGIAAAEAMALGLPMLLSNLDVLREVSGGNAIFFNPQDPAELAARIREFRNGKYRMKELSERGRELARQRYSREAYVAKLLEIYRENMR